VIVQIQFRSVLFGLAAALGFSFVSAGEPGAMQMKQIEDVARTIAKQYNANPSNLDDMTQSTRAVALGINVRFEYVLRVKKGVGTSKLLKFERELRQDIVPKACRVNANNPAFDSGLYYTFAYTNGYGEALAEFVVDKAVCLRPH